MYKILAMDPAAVSSEYSRPPYPPGVRFLPTDMELINSYLLVKLEGGKLPCDVIKEEDVYAYNPEELTEKYEDFEGNWYFFNPRDRKYARGSRPSRSAGDGYWKATGSDKDIIDEEGKKIGVKKSLTFHLGEQPRGIKTKWLMEEYRIDDFQQPIHPETTSMLLDAAVLSRIHYGRSGSRGATASGGATNRRNADNRIIENSLQVTTAEADQPDDTMDDAPAFAEVAAVEPMNGTRQDQFNPSMSSMISEADQADVATEHNPAVLPEATVAEPVDNIFQDLFDPSTLGNSEGSRWDMFQPQIDLLNDFNLTIQYYDYSEFLDSDCAETIWNGEVDNNERLQESSLDRATAQVQQPSLGGSPTEAQEQQSLGNSPMNAQEKQGSKNSVENTGAPVQRAMD